MWRPRSGKAGMKGNEKKQRETAMAGGPGTKRSYKVIVLSEGEEHTLRCKNKFIEEWGYIYTQNQTEEAHL